MRLGSEAGDLFHEDKKGLIFLIGVFLITISLNMHIIDNMSKTDYAVL